MKILVTDGNSLPALAITRSLGQAGHQVIVGHQDDSSLASYSRYASSHCIYPDPAKHSDTFIEFLLDYVEHHNIDAIFPVTDITTIPVTQHKARFEKFCKIPFADYEIVDNAANKAHVLELARQLNIDTPASVVINSYEELDIDKLGFGFPLVIKPARSRILSEQGWVFTTVTYACNESDLRSKLRSYEDIIFPIILQERITGPGLGIFMCFNKGEAIAAFSHKRLREKPPSGGVSVLRKSISLDPLAHEFSDKLLSALKWQGIAMVEFKVDERDNRPKLMEINGRFWGSLQLAIDAGVNFPVLLANTLENTNVSKITSYKLDVKTRWLWGDIDALMLRMLKSDDKQQLPENADSKLVYLLKFLIFWEPRLHYDVLRFRDIRPWLYESYRWFKNALR